MRCDLLASTAQTLDSIPTWAFQTEKELNPDGPKKESERDRAVLALTSTLNKLIKRLEEKQSPELVKKYTKRKVVPKKPLPSPRSTGENSRTRRSSQVSYLCPLAGAVPEGTAFSPSRVHISSCLLEGAPLFSLSPFYH